MVDLENIKFQVVKQSGVRRLRNPFKEGNNICYLYSDGWNDYSYRTLFHMHLFDKNGQLHEVGSLKIGYYKQTIEKDTDECLGETFKKLPDNFFSLGMDVEYYNELIKLFSEDTHKIKQFLEKLNDVANSSSVLAKAKKENVFKTSLLRGLADGTIIKHQYARVINGGVPLTPFHFSYKTVEGEDKPELSFKVSPDSTPPTNMHALIGRNGTGKTTLLNSMALSIITNNQSGNMAFYDKDENSYWDEGEKIADDYFSGLVLTAFSVFDSYDEFIKKQKDNKKYNYIGFREILNDGALNLKSVDELHDEFASALADCFSNDYKRERWTDAINILKLSDGTFDEGINMLNHSLGELQNKSDEKLEEKLKNEAVKVIKNMSAGHSVVLLAITKLVAYVEEKTLILIDEPETHLHPPLLSAFIRALSNLLDNRNGVAIIATHSPIVLQEIPRSCVWKISRSGDVFSHSRPNIETFGENISTLTREIFGLDVLKSGFHQLLLQSVEEGKNYDDIIKNYKNKLGFEARAILKVLIRQKQKDEEN